ncbi:MAG: formylglycine-generating enzyme family protein [Actinomycetota bacterium]|nr:formylglycine-generating enzyme family protein [Actinomycetota bacterium]
MVNLAGVASLHDLSDRQLMGLPPQFAERVPAGVFGHESALFAATPDELVRVLEGADEPFNRRFVAGRLLALIGDPRIRATDPALVEVPGGPATLGLPAEAVDRIVERWQAVGVRQDWIEKECPEYQAHIPTLRMMRYPVTNYEFRQFLIETGETELPTSWRFGVYPHERANEPVWTVTPVAAEQYARWLTDRTGHRYRLPTEAEWEYAAGGGEGREYPWGEDFDPEAANTAEAGPLTTTPVGCYPRGRSKHGLDDLGGNVEEWVADDYRPYPGGQDVADDLAVLHGSYRVCRGGSFTRYGDLARSRRRHGRYDREIYAIGFRLVQVSEGEPGPAAREAGHVD